MNYKPVLQDHMNLHIYVQHIHKYKNVSFIVTFTRIRKNRMHS